MESTLSKLDSYVALDQEEMINTEGGALVFVTIFGAIKVKTVAKTAVATGLAAGAISAR